MGEGGGFLAVMVGTAGAVWLHCILAFSPWLALVVTAGRSTLPWIGSALAWRLGGAITALVLLFVDLG